MRSAGGVRLRWRGVRVGRVWIVGRGGGGMVKGVRGLVGEVGEARGLRGGKERWRVGGGMEVAGVLRRAVGVLKEVEVLRGVEVLRIERWWV